MYARRFVGTCDDCCDMDCSRRPFFRQYIWLGAFCWETRFAPWRMYGAIPQGSCFQYVTYRWLLLDSSHYSHSSL